MKSRLAVPSVLATLGVVLAVSIGQGILKTRATTQVLEAPRGTRRVAVSRDGTRIAAAGDGGIAVREAATHG